MESDIQKSLTGAGKKAEGSGKTAGANYSKGFNSSIESTSDKMLQPIKDSMDKAGKEAGESAGRNVTEGIEKEVKKASPKISNAGNGIGKGLGNKMSDGFARSRFTKTLASAGIKLGALIPIVGAVIGAIGALVSGLFAVGAAVGSASQTLVVIPGLIGAAVAAMATIMIGFKGVGQAMKDGMDPKRAKEFQESLKKLSPEAQKFVKQLVSMKGEFKSLRDSAASGMFPGLTEALKTLGDGGFFKTLRVGLKEVGKGVGSAGKSIADSLSNTTFLKNFGDVLKANKKIVMLFGRATGDLVRAFTALLDAASPLTLKFSRWFANMSMGLRVTAETGNVTGTLAKRFADADSIMGILIRTTKNLFGGIADIGKIAKPTGVSLLQAFEKSTKKMRDFVNSASGAKKISKYFKDVEPNVRAVSSLVGKLGLAFLRLGASPGIKATADAFAKIIPDLEKALDAGTKTIGPKIAVLVGEIAKMFTALEESGAIAAVIDIFTGVAKALTTILNLPTLGPFIGTILKFAAAYKALILVSKLGALMFPIGAMKKFNTGIKESTVGAQGLGQAFQKGGILGAAKAYSGATSNVGKLSTGLTGATSSMKLFGGEVARRYPTFRAFGDGMLKSAKGAIGQTTAMQGLSKSMRTASASTGAFLRNNSRAIGSGALMAVAMTGVADKAGLQTAAMGATAGMMVGGPWGAAIGGGIGALVDFQKAYNDNIDSITRGSKALESNDMGQLSASYSELTGKLDELHDRTNATGVGDFVSDYFSAFRSIGFNAEGAARKAEQIGEAMDANIEKTNRLKDATQGLAAIAGLEEARRHIKALKKEGNFTLDLSAEGGPETIRSLQDIAKGVEETTGSSAKASRKVAQFIQQLGLGPAAADLLGDSFAGLTPKIDDLSNTEISLNDKQILDSLSTINGQFDDAINTAAEGARFDISAVGLDNVGNARKDVEGLFDQVKALPLDKKIVVKTDTGTAIIEAGDVFQALNRVPPYTEAQLKVMKDKGMDQTFIDLEQKRRLAAQETRIKLGMEDDASKPLEVLSGKLRGVSKGQYVATLMATNLAEPVVASYNAKLLKISRKEYMARLNANPDKLRTQIAKANGIKINPKTGKILGDGKDFKNKADNVKNTKFKDKTGKIKGDKGGFDKDKGSVDRASFSDKFVNIKANLSGLGGKVRDLLGFATGGYVSGAGTSLSDSIPAMLSNGEFVINALQTKKYRKLLESINSGKSPTKLLPTISRDIAMKSSASKSQSSELQVISGKLSIDESGNAFILGVAQGVYDNNADFDDTVRGM